MNEEKERVEWETVLERVRVRQLHCISIKNRKTREQMMIEQQHTHTLSLSLSAFAFLRVLCKDDDDDDEDKRRSFQWRQIFLSINPLFFPYE